MMAERGLDLTYETIRYWCLKFGHLYAKQMRKRKVWGDTWHLDEVFCRINGQVHYLWRAVDQDGQVLDILVQRKRNKPAADRFFRKRKMRKFKSLVQAQRFLSAMGEIYDHFQIGRHKTTASVYRTLLKRNFDSWRTIAQNPLSA